MNIRRLIITLAIVCLVVAVGIRAQGQDNSKGKSNGQGDKKAIQEEADSQNNGKDKAKEKSAESSRDRGEKGDRTEKLRRSGWGDRASETGRANRSDKAKQGGFDEVDMAIRRIHQGSQGELRQWMRANTEHRAELADAVQKQIMTELTLIRRIAMQEKANQTVEAIDKVMASRKRRYRSLQRVMERRGPGGQDEQNRELHQRKQSIRRNPIEELKKRKLQEMQKQGTGGQRKSGSGRGGQQ